MAAQQTLNVSRRPANDRFMWGLYLKEMAHIGGFSRQPTDEHQVPGSTDEPARVLSSPEAEDEPSDQ